LMRKGILGFVLFGKVFGVEGTGGVEDGDDHDADVGEDGRPHAGDAQRAEDEADLSKVNFSMELFEIYTKGFLQAAGDAFTPLEKQTLPWGAKLMTMECGMRFLADYLEGDHYFHINYEQQNLNRARTQFKLTADMERNWDAMQKVIEKYC